jgi:hypothetical protein
MGNAAKEQEVGGRLCFQDNNVWSPDQPEDDLERLEAEVLRTAASYPPEHVFLSLHMARTSRTAISC